MNIVDSFWNKSYYDLSDKERQLYMSIRSEYPIFEYEKEILSSQYNKLLDSYKKIQIIFNTYENILNPLTIIHIDNTLREIRDNLTEFYNKLYNEEDGFKKYWDLQDDIKYLSKNLISINDLLSRELR